MRLNREQESILRSMHFWRRNQLVAKRDNDVDEIKKSDSAIKYNFEKADQNKIPFSIQNKVLSHAEENRYEGFSDMKFEKEHNHTMQIKNIEGDRDIDEIAKIVITNAVNGKEHELSVWASDGENNELAPHYVYMNMPGELDLENNDTYQDALADNLHDGQLFEIIKYDDEIESVISDYHDGVSTEFEFNIPTEKQTMSLQEIVIDEELADILIKSENNLLEKSDLVDFGKLVGNDLQDLNFSFDEDLKKSFDNALSNSNIAKDEIPHVKASYESLSIKLPDNFSNKKSLNQDKELAQGLER